MKKYNYTHIGAHGEEVPETGTLFDLLNTNPYFFLGPIKRLPPLIVINSILEAGLDDGGMGDGASWTPFTIEIDEYQQLATYCKGFGYEITETPKWVESYMDFLIWVNYLDIGIPWKKNKHLTEEINDIEKQFHNATEQKFPTDEIDKLQLELVKKGDEIYQWERPYYEKHWKKNKLGAEHQN